MLEEPIGHPDGSDRYTEVNGINDDGRIVGSEYRDFSAIGAPDERFGLLWNPDPSGYTEFYLDGLYGSEVGVNSAEGISETGLIVGGSAGVAVTWEEGSSGYAITELEAGYAYSDAYGVNDSH